MGTYKGLPEGAEVVGSAPSFVGLPQGAEVLPESSILSETLKAPARVVGGIAQEAGEAAQYVTGDRVGRGIRAWGEKVQKDNAQSEGFRAAHPIISTAGDVAEGVAKMAPYLAADLLVPEVAVPATAGRIAKGVAALRSAPFAAGVLPAVAGAAQGQRSYEKGVENGLSSDEALSASRAPAVVTGAGMAAMGALSHGVQALGGEAKTLAGQFTKHAAADTGIMMAQGVATEAAEKATGIAPEAKPLDQLKDPKAWAQAALTGGLFAGLGVAKKSMIARALKEHTTALENAEPAEREAGVAALAAAVHPEDPAAQAAFHAEVADKIQSGEPVISEEIINRLTAEPKVEDARDSILKGLEETVASGGEVNPLEVHETREEAGVVEALKAEAPAPQVEPPTDPTQIRAEAWAKEGKTISKLTGVPDAEVAARLDEMGYTLRDNGSVKTGGKRVREWAVEKKAEPSPSLQGEAEVAPVGDGAPESKRYVVPTLDIGDPTDSPETRAHVAKALQEGHGFATTTSKGVNLKVIHMTDEAGQERLLAVNKKNVIVGDLIYVTDATGDTNPSVWVADRYRRNGVASKLYDIAEQRGGVIPDVSDEHQVRTDAGQAFRTARAKRSGAGGLAPLKDREQRLAYDDNPNLVVGMKDNRIALVDQKSKEVLGVAAVKDGKLGAWEEGREPATPAERVQIEGLFRRHLGEAARLSRVYRGDSIHPDGLGEGSTGDLGKGFYFAEDAHIAEYFTDGSDKAHTRAFDVNLKQPFDLMDRNIGKTKAWKGMLKTIPEGLNKSLLERWAKGDLDVKNSYAFLARSFGKEPAEFNDFLASHGYDGVVDSGVRGVSDGSRQYVIFDKALAKLEAERLSRAEGSGLVADEVRTHLKDVISKLKVPVEVVDKASDIPGLRPDAPAFNGAFHQGKIYLNAEHLTSLKEAEHVLLKHELAHAGLLGSLGREGMEKVFTKAWGDLNSGVREFAKEKGIDTKSKAGKMEATEEFLVSLAESGTKHPLWDKFVATFKQAARKLGFDLKYSERELRSLVLEATAAMRQGKAEQEGAELAARFSRLAAEARPKDVDQFTDRVSASLVKRVLSDTAGNVFRAIMPLDKTIKMAQSLPAYAPIKENLTRLQELRRAKEAAGTAPSIDAKHVTDEVARVVKTPEALKAYNDLTHKATLYELRADPAKAIPWTEKSWKEGGKLKQTGLSLGQAVKEVRDLWNALTPEQRAVQQRAVAHMKELKKEHIEAQVDGLRAIFPDDVFAKANELSTSIHKELWKAEQIGGPQAAGERRAELATQHGIDVVELAEQIVAIKSEGMLKGDYAPLMRFGDHIVSTFVKTEGGEGKRLKVQHFETKKEAMEAVAAIRRDPSKMATYAVQTEAQRNVVNIPLEFLSKMQAAMDAKGIAPEQQEQLMQDFKAARVATMPRNSLEGNRLNREGIAGYEDNAVRSYAAYVQRASQAIANLKYGTKIDQVFRDMGNNIKAYQDPDGEWDPAAVERMSRLKDNLYTLEKSHSSERINAATKAIGKSTFLWYLTSPSVYAVQWSQPFITTIPKLASRYGFGKAFGDYVSEAKNFIAGKFSDQKIDEFDRSNNFIAKEIFGKIEAYREAVTAEERARLSREMKAIYDRFSEAEQKLLVLKVMSHQGAIDLSAAHSLHDLVNSSDPLNKGIDWLVDKGGVFMRASETGSRRAAAITAFRMALRDKKDFMAANDYASHIIDDTLFDFSSQNRAAIMKGNVGRVVGQFQFFRLHMFGKTVQLAKDAMQGEFRGEARKELAYMMGTSMALAGAAGTPLAMLAGNTVTDAIWDAAAFLFGDPDDPWNPKKDFEDALKDAVGDEVGNTFMKGLPYLMGVDISKRVGLGGMASVIQGEVPPGASPTDKANWYAAKLLGPSWGMVTDSIKTLDAIGDGDYGTAAEVGSPKVLRDFMKAYGISQDGVRAAGGRTVLQADEVNPFSIALQMVGINPADISLAQEEARGLSNLSTQVRQRRSLLTKHVTEATLAGDYDARAVALEAVNAWGQKHPALKITQKELANAVKRGMDLKAGKLSKREEVLKEGGL